jgi:hypothetical protein
MGEYALYSSDSRIATSGCGVLWERLWTFGFHKMQGIILVAEQLLTSHEGLRTMELVFENILNM